MTTYTDTISDSFGVQAVAIRKTNINPFPSKIVPMSMKGKSYKLTSPVQSRVTTKESQDTGLNIGIALYLRTSPQFFKTQLVGIRRTNTRSYSMKILPGAMKNKPYKTLSYQADYTSGDSVNQTEVGAIVLPPNIILQ